MIEFLAHPDFPNYEISKNGKIRSKPGGRRKGGLLNPVKSYYGYFVISLFMNNVRYRRFVHRLVLETYVSPCPDGMEGCHNNGNKQDNHLENLRWDTSSNNAFDKIKHGTQPDSRGENHGRAKITNKDARMIIYMYRTGLFLQREIGNIYNICNQEVSYIVTGNGWKHLWTI